MEEDNYPQGVGGTENEAKPRKEPKPYGVAIVSIILSVFRLYLSFRTCNMLLFSNEPWTEGKVYGMLTGFFNLPYLAVILGLNKVAVYRQSKNESSVKSLLLVIVTWMLWALLVVLTVFIILYRE